MANIIQAAKWLREGKKVRESDWASGIYYESRNGYGKIILHDILNDQTETGYFLPSDLASENWEIFDE